MHLKLLQNIKKLTLVDLTMRLRSRLCKTVVVLLSISLAGSVFATVRTAGSPTEIEDAIAASVPGDTVVIKDGTYTNLEILFNVDGTASSPILLQAQSKGGVSLEGNSGLKIAGDYLIVDGLHFQNGERADGRGIIRFYDDSTDTSTFANHSRLTNTTIDGFNSQDSEVRYHWVNVRGSHNEIDHNHFTNMQMSGVMVIVNRRDSTDANYPNFEDNHHFHHNYFDTRISVNYPDRANGQEGLKIGSGAEAGTDSNTIAEYNLFYKIDGEAEIISSKSDSNIFRYNTFLDNQGSITLRNGDDNQVYGNFIDGGGINGTGGIRIIGNGHKVYNNHIKNTKKAGITIYAGTGGNGSEYRSAEDLEIYNNTIVNSKPSLVIGQVGSDPFQHINAPINSIIANNAIYYAGSTALFDDDPKYLDIEPSITFIGNIAYGSSTSISNELAVLGRTITAAQIDEINPGLSADVDGVFVPTVSSAVVNAVNTNYSLANIDIHGLSRDSIHDVGAAEYTTTASINKPLTVADVGPTDLLPKPTLPIIRFPVAETYVDSGKPDKYFGSVTKIKVKNSSTKDKVGYMRFDVSAIDANISSAILHVFTKNSNNTTITTDIGAVSADGWDQHEVNWNDNLEIGDSIGSMTTNNSDDYQKQTVDITAYVQTQIDGDGILSLAFSQTNGLDVAQQIKTSDFSDENPYLEIILAAPVDDNESDYHGDESACFAAGYFYGWDALCYASSSEVPSYTANVTADTYVQRGEGSATTDYGTDDTIKSKEGSGDADSDRIIVMKFDVSAANSATITSATLNVYGYTKNGDSVKQKIKPIDHDNWTENGLTWDELPDLASSAGSFTVADADYGWRTLDITALVQGEVDGDGTLSLAIMEADETGIFFYMLTKEYNGGSHKAYIDIEF
tara:strand:- start:24977 stop:27685 length:2709 start_codon:yes stop_codon:yes gene_type:complete